LKYLFGFIVVFSLPVLSTTKAPVPIIKSDHVVQIRLKSPSNQVLNELTQVRPLRIMSPVEIFIWLHCRFFFASFINDKGTCSNRFFKFAIYFTILL
jgi:hypothetical protein